MEQLIAVLLGVVAGTVTGVIPGIGVLVAMVVCTPLLLSMDIISLLLFYMSLASMVQFTGTVPSVYLGVPGETNSLPAVIEGTKHTKKGIAQLGIGVSAMGSVIGSLIAVLITWLLLHYLSNHLAFFFSNNVKFFIYTAVILFCLTVYNKGNFLVNSALCIIGFCLSLPGESDIVPGFRFWFGIEDLKYGIPLMPLLIGFIVVPNLLKIQSIKDHKISRQLKISFLTVLQRFGNKITSVLRGSVIGYFCGLVPGVTTVLATNASYSIEKKLHSNNSTRQLMSSETANNSGQFSSMLPLLLIGIPITGSEVVLYSLLLDAGWSPFQFNNLTANIDMIFQQIVPWFVFVNCVGLMVAWPLSKTILKILRIKKAIIIIGLSLVVVGLNLYIGMLDYRPLAYTLYLILFSICGILIKRFEPVPLIFIFILGNELEGVFYRQFII